MQIVLGGAVLLQLSVLPGLLGVIQPLVIVTATVVASAAAYVQSAGRIWCWHAWRGERVPSPAPGEPAPLPCQLVLDLPCTGGDSLTDFMPALQPRRLSTRSWAARWPGAVCVLIGPSRGKSHLAKIWAQRPVR